MERRDDPSWLRDDDDDEDAKLRRVELLTKLWTSKSSQYVTCHMGQLSLSSLLHNL